MSNRWQELQQKFINAIRNTEGCTKMSSGEITIGFSQDDKVWVEMGCYDIGDWPRHLSLGAFDTEDQAYEATAAKVGEAITILNDRKNEPEGE